MLNFGLDAFTLKIILSFFVGGIWITFSTILAERYGSKIGGVLLGLPSTILISLFFIAWTQDLKAASRATDIVPMIELIDVLFILIYVLLLRFQFIFALLSATLFWFITSFSLVYYEFDKFWISVILLVPVVILTYFLLENKCKVISTKNYHVKNSLGIILFRATLSGGIISSAVLISKWGNPLLGGAFAAYPAAYTSAMIITYLARGKEFSAAVMKPLMLSGGVNITVYVIAVRYCYLHLSLLPGTFIAFLISLISGYLTYLFVQKRMS